MSEPWRCGTCGQGYPCECRILGVAHPDGGAPPEPSEVWRELERIWCEALLPEGPDVIQRVTMRAVMLRRAASRPGHP
jgi:hypothetical protein